MPDLPVCITTGDTGEDVEANIKEAIEYHLEGLREDGLPVPEPSSEVGFVQVAQAAVRVCRNAPPENLRLYVAVHAEPGGEGIEPAGAGGFFWIHSEAVAALFV